MKPHVICLMAASVDGRTLHSRWRPEGTAGELFEQVHDELAGDAWLVGRVTGQEFAKGKSYPASSQVTFPRQPWFAQRDAKAYGVVLDAHGKLAWGRSDIGGDPIVVVLLENVSDAHLAGLRSESLLRLCREVSTRSAPHTGHPQSRTRREAPAARRRRWNKRCLSARWVDRRTQSNPLSSSGRCEGCQHRHLSDSPPQRRRVHRLVPERRQIVIQHR
jgi:hypothetical protein